MDTPLPRMEGDVPVKFFLYRINPREHRTLWIFFLHTHCGHYPPKGVPGLHLDHSFNREGGGDSSYGRLRSFISRCTDSRKDGRQ